MYIYYIPGIIAFVCVMLVPYVGGRTRVALLIASVGVTGMISGMRWMADVDYPGYLEMFDETPKLRDFNADSIAAIHGEPLFLLINSAFRSLNIDFFYYSFAAAVISIGVKSFVMGRFTSNPAYAFAIYLCVNFTTIEFIQIRWALATTLIIVSIYLYWSRKHLLSFLAFACACGFQYFSLAVLPVLFFATSKSRRVTLGGFLALTLIALVLDAGVLLEYLPIDAEAYFFKRTTRYLEESLSQVGVLSIARLLIYLIVPYILLRSHNIDRDDYLAFTARMAYGFVALTLLFTFVPLMHFRMSVLADYFGAAYLANSIALSARPVLARALGVLAGMAFCVWYILDLWNYIEADRIWTYQTWMPQL